MSEIMRRPNRYVVGADSGRVFSDPAFKFRQLESIRNYLRIHYPHFKAQVISTPEGNNYLYKVTLKNVKDVDASVLATITRDLEAQGINAEIRTND